MKKTRSLCLALTQLSRSHSVSLLHSLSLSLNSLAHPLPSSISSPKPAIRNRKPDVVGRGGRVVDGISNIGIVRSGVAELKAETKGSVNQFASSSQATEWVKGKQMEEVLSIKNTEIAKHLSLPPVKLHCSMLAEDALKAAVKDYESKRAKSNASEEAAPVKKAADA